MSPPLPPIADLQCGVFTYEQAVPVGWTARHLLVATRRGDVDRLWRGVYARPVTDDAIGRADRIAQQAVAAALMNHSVGASHLASAALWTWPWWASDPRACVTTPLRALTTAGPVHVHRAPLLVGETGTYRGAVPTTAAGRTVVDIAREFGVESGLVTADAALRSGHLDRDGLAAAVAHAAGRRGVEAARRVLELVDPRSESALESRSRFRIDAAGLPPPIPQAVILDRFGRFVARVDFLWLEQGVVGEANGRAKYERDTGRRAREGARGDQLERLGLIHEAWEWADLDPFDRTARRLHHALTHGAVTPGRRRDWRVDLRNSA